MASGSNDPVRDFIREHGGMILSVGAIALCILVAWLMQPGRGGGARSVPMSIGGAERQASRSADYRPAGRSSMDFAPKWGELPLSPEIAPPAPQPQADPAPEPEPEAPPIPQTPEPEAPPPPKAEGLVKKAAGGGGAAGPAPVMTAVPTFEKREARERGEAAEPGAPAAAAGSVEARRARTMRAIIMAGQDGSLQRYGLDKETLYRLEKLGAELSQYVQPDGTFKISEKDAKILNNQLGVIRGKDDKLPGPSGFGY
ncbi:MAG: hypothetical protein HY928_00995 [Elusimicrobia bacterium]|nr:hypothetical protein [Elusimicrobiota bacterium]